MSEISKEELNDLERSLIGGPELYSERVQKKLIAEIRRLRALLEVRPNNEKARAS